MYEGRRAELGQGRPKSVCYALLQQSITYNGDVWIVIRKQ